VIARAVLALLLLSGAAAAGDLPAHPRDIEYPELDWKPPDPKAHRTAPADENAPILYVVRDDALPLVELKIWFAPGSLAESPAGMDGMAAALLLRGGTEERTGPQLTEAFEARGGTISVEVGRDWGSLTAEVLTRDFDWTVDRLAEIAHRPAFREEEIERYRKEFADRYGRRNDRLRAVTRRTFNRLALPEAHRLNAEPTPESIAPIDRDLLKAWAAARFRGRRLLISLSGDVPKEGEALDRLLTRFRRDPEQEPAPRVFTMGRNTAPPPRGRVHVVDRPGATQGHLRIGIATVARNHEDWIPLTLTHYVLGGSGFPSRITKRIRSDEGLAYSAGARFDTDWSLGGTWYVGLQTRSAMVPYAIRLVFEELGKMIEDGVTDAELDRAKSALTGQLPSRFETAAGTAATFVELELTSRPLDFYDGWSDRVNAVTKEDVLRVAKEHLMHRDRAVVLVVGDKEAILAGDPTGLRKDRLTDFGEVVDVEVR